MFAFIVSPIGMIAGVFSIALLITVFFQILNRSSREELEF